MKEFNINERKEICEKCPLLTKDWRCNSKLYLNPETNEVSTYSKVGFIRGCNCQMNVKMRNINSHCIAGKW